MKIATNNKRNSFLLGQGNHQESRFKVKTYVGEKVSF